MKQEHQFPPAPQEAAELLEMPPKHPTVRPGCQGWSWQNSLVWIPVIKHKCELMSVWPSAAKLLVHMVNTSHGNCSPGMSRVLSVLVAAWPVKTAPICWDTVSRAAVTNPHEGQVRTKSKKSSRKTAVFRVLLVPKASLYISLLQWGAFPAPFSLKFFKQKAAHKSLEAGWVTADFHIHPHAPSYLTTKHIQTTTQPSTARG